MTFEELREKYTSDQDMARDLFAQLGLEQALRRKAETKLANQAPIKRRENR